MGGGRHGQWHMALGRQQARCGIESDPSRAGQVGLHPGMQFSAVLSRRIGAWLEQVARHEARGETQPAQHCDQQPCTVTARPCAITQGFLR